MRLPPPLLPSGNRRPAHRLRSESSSSMSRKKVMAANWKMYKTPDQTRDFFRDFLPLVAGHARDEIVVCPPFLDRPAAIEAAEGSNVAIGGQNVHWKEEGAFTGETSAAQLLAVGVTHVIIGHSE